jgi:DUF1009 family protein
VKYGLIAGEGRFPLLVLQSAKQQGHEMVAVAVKEEASTEIEQWADRCYWISLGELSKLIKIFHDEQISEAVMAGRVKHSRIYSSIRPDWRLLKLLTSLPRKNTNSLIGAVTSVLADEGIRLLDSTAFLQPFMAPEGIIAGRRPTADESADIEYGREVAAALAGFDVGQTVVICEKACVAVEAMEGTNAAILRAAEWSNGRRLTVVKAARPKQDMRFDVPVAGPTTIEKMRMAGATALALEAGRTLLIDREPMIAAANNAKIAVVGYDRS